MNTDINTIRLLGRDFTLAMVMGLPYAPYELFLGVWLVIKGFN